MSGAKKATPDEMRLSGKEFDRIMKKVLQVKPESKKRAVKKRTSRKKANAGK